MIVRYEKAGVIGLLDNAGHLILAQVRLNEQTMREKTKVSNQKGGKKEKTKWQLSTTKPKRQETKEALHFNSFHYNFSYQTFKESPCRLHNCFKMAFFSAFWPPPVWGGTWRPQSHRSLPCICLHCLNCSQRCVSFKVETDKGRWIEHSRLSDDYALQTNIISHRMDNFLLARLVCGKKHKNRMICPFILMLIWKLMFNNIWKVKECSKWNDDISYRQFLDMKITNTTNTNIIRNLNLKSQSATYVKHKGAKFVNLQKD